MEPGGNGFSLYLTEAISQISIFDSLYRHSSSSDRICVDLKSDSEQICKLNGESIEMNNEDSCSMSVSIDMTEGCSDVSDLASAGGETEQFDFKVDLMEEDSSGGSPELPQAITTFNVSQHTTTQYMPHMHSDFHTDTDEKSSLETISCAETEQKFGSSYVPNVKETFKSAGTFFSAEIEHSIGSGYVPEVSHNLKMSVSSLETKQKFGNGYVPNVSKDFETTVEVLSSADMEERVGAGGYVPNGIVTYSEVPFSPDAEQSDNLPDVSVTLPTMEREYTSDQRIPHISQTIEQSPQLVSSEGRIGRGYPSEVSDNFHLNRHVTKNIQNDDFIHFEFPYQRSSVSTEASPIAQSGLMEGGTYVLSGRSEVSCNIPQHNNAKYDVSDIKDCHFSFPHHNNIITDSSTSNEEYKYDTQLHSSMSPVLCHTQIPLGPVITGSQSMPPAVVHTSFVESASVMDIMHGDLSGINYSFKGEEQEDGDNDVKYELESAAEFAPTHIVRDISLQSGSCSESQCEIQPPVIASPFTNSITHAFAFSSITPVYDR